VKFLLACLKTLSNFKSCSEIFVQFRLSIALIGQFFLVYFLSRFSEQFSLLQAGFGTNCKGTSSLKRVTGRNFTISKKFDFIEASRNFISDFLHKKTTENCENY
jgi:hypothetical protein